MPIASDFARMWIRYWTFGACLIAYATPTPTKEAD